MSLTRVQLRDQVRRLLEDTGAAVLFSDTELNDYMGDGYLEVGRVAPLEEIQAITTVALQTTYYPTGFVRRVLGVLLDGVALPQVDLGVIGETGTAQCWARLPPYALVLNQAVSAGRSLSVRLQVYVPFPATDGAVSGLQEVGERLVVLVAALMALERRIVADGKRGDGGKLRDAERGLRARVADARRRCQTVRVS